MCRPNWILNNHNQIPHRWKIFAAQGTNRFSARSYYMKHVSIDVTIKKKMVGEEVKTMEKERFCEQIRAQETSMYRYALGVLRNPADAEDAVGESVLKAYAHLDQLKDPGRFRPWVMSILANVARTMLAQRNRLEYPGDMNQYEKSVSAEQRELWYLVMELPAEFRDAVILYYYDGFRTREIARVLGISEGTVKSRLNRARKKLRAEWEGTH